MIKTIGLFLLLLLKILGWALLLLLLFLIAVLLLVLFVPVRYDVRMQNERSTKPVRDYLTAGLRLQLHADWLLHLLHVSVSYGPDGMQNKIRVAGIDMQKVLAQLAKRKEAKQKRREAKKRSHTRQESHNVQQTKSSAAKADGTGQMGPGQEDSRISFDVGTETEKDRQVLEESDSETGKAQSAEDQEQFLKKESGSSEAPSKTVPHKHRKKVSKTKDQKKLSKKALKPQKESGSSEPGSFTKIRTQLSRLHKEFTDEANRHAVSHLWKELLKLLRSYKPRKLKADLTFSLADPALTGEATGVISLMPWIYRYPCSIIPDFASETLYIEGEILVRGKVAVFIFAFSLLRLLRDKELMQAVRRLMKRDSA